MFKGLRNSLHREFLVDLLQYICGYDYFSNSRVKLFNTLIFDMSSFDIGVSNNKNKRIMIYEFKRIC